MIYCDADNEAASKRVRSRRLCENRATYFVMNRKGHILCAVCGNHKGETIKFRKRGTFTTWGADIFTTARLGHHHGGMMRP